MKLFVNGLFMSGLLVLAAIFSGCSNVPKKGSPFVSSPPKPRNFAGQFSTDTNQPVANIARFRVGDTVVVSFSGAPDPIPDHVEGIKEDGNITLDLIGPIYALGKTTGELQNEIQTNYVPTFYRRLTVTVKSPNDRVYYVGGQIQHPGVQNYLGDTTVSKAIQAAGDFNDFADHTVTLIRIADGKHIKVNVDKVKDGKQVDPPVYPGDQIDVPRSIW
jgi:protein involved in polysaccharide export with SLBB domain